MSDITTELRSLARWLRQLSANEPEPECKASHTDCANDCEEAADEIDRLRAANRYLIDMHDAVIDDARKYTAAQAEIARLRDAIESCIPALEIGRDAAHVISVFGDDRGATIGDALAKASAALAQVAEVGE